MSPAEVRPYAEASRSLLRDTVLGAVDRLLAEQPWSAVTMGEVAKAAGVSRQTVYNELGNRRDLAQAYASWAGDQLLDEVERCVAEHRDDLLDALVAAFTVFLDLGHGHPFIRALEDPNSAGDLAAALATGRPSPLVAGATVRVAAIILESWPDLPADAVDVASEALVRLAISHLLQPVADNPEAARRVAVLLGPFIAHVQATAGQKTL